jgi:glycosyltransferase involved in cell wall biosynthesis
LAFETYATYGARLATQFKLYAYYFCADRTEQGIEIGYPVSYFSNIFRYLTAAMIDSSYLAHIFKDRFAIPPDEGTKLKVIYTPAQLKLPETPVAEPQVARAKGRRPCILWGGRLDRQKRFDLAVAVARVMPDVDFHCWGKAVLDKPPELGNLPENLILNPPFKNYEELPLTDCDGWLYTSFWDGLPTILIELGALGMPIVASAVGGVPELIDESTGWLFDPRADAGEVAKQIRAMLADPAERVVRATALQQRVRDRHSMESYIAAIRSI